MPNLEAHYPVSSVIQCCPVHILCEGGIDHFTPHFTNLLSHRVLEILHKPMTRFHDNP